jgi:hypothetical protein
MSDKIPQEIINPTTMHVINIEPGPKGGYQASFRIFLVGERRTIGRMVPGSYDTPVEAFDAATKLARTTIGANPQLYAAPMPRIVTAKKPGRRDGDTR